MKNIQLRTYVATLLLLLGSTWSVFATPQADGPAAIKTDDGYLVVWNQPEIHFTVELKGKNVRPMSSPNTGSVAFAVDGVVFQIQSVAISEFHKNVKKQKLNNQAILLAHQDWETQYLKQTLGAEVNVMTLPQPSGNGDERLLWKFTMPKNKARQQIYLTTVSGNYVVILNGTPEGKAAVSDTTIQKLLLDTLSTLKASSRPIDVMKLRDSIRKNPSPPANQTPGKLQHNWHMEQGKDGVYYTSNYPAPVPFSMNGEPEATLAMEFTQISSNGSAVADVVKSEIAEIRKALQIAEYVEADGHKPQNNIASWVEAIDGQQVAFIKYRVAGVKGKLSVLPRTTQHAILIKNGKLYFVHLTVIFAKHQEEVRADQLRLIKEIISK